MRRLAYPLLGLWVVLMATASVLQLRNGDVLEALITPALGVLAGVGALLCRQRRDGRRPSGNSSGSRMPTSPNQAKINASSSHTITRTQSGGVPLSSS